MDPKKLVEEHKIYLEDLERWVVPLEVVDQALSMKSAKELEENLDKLQIQMSELNKVFNDLGNING
jgi:ribose 5-phosphate isomerase